MDETETVEVYRQYPGIVVREVGNAIFLVDQKYGSIFNLNTIGAGIWRLVKQPRTPDEVVDTVQTAFPDEPPEKIEQDVTELLDELEEEGLIVLEEVRAVPSAKRSAAGT